MLSFVRKSQKHSKIATVVIINPGACIEAENICVADKART